MKKIKMINCLRIIWYFIKATLPFGWPRKHKPLCDCGPCETRNIMRDPETVQAILAAKQDSSKAVPVEEVFPELKND